MNLNQLAKAICKIEGGRVNLPIAQVKEVLRCLSDVLMNCTPEELTATLAKLVK